MKIIIAVLLAASLFSSAAYAQITFGDPAEQEVSVKISDNGDVHVTHHVKDSKKTQQVEFLSPDYTNFTIIDEDNEEPQYAEASGQNPGIVLFPTKNNVTIEYDIPNAVKQRSGMWTWDYRYLANTEFYLPSSVKLPYVNGNLIQLGNQKGIQCHGCQVFLEYELEPTIITKQVEWEGKSFDVKIITLADIPKLDLDQPAKSLSFEVTEPGKHITLVIPRELLWSPYDVALNDKLILKQERLDVDGKVWLHIIPKEKGTLKITGVSVVPEFPFATILVLSTAMAAIVYTTRFSRR
ncbi:MAG: hypothetical protein EB164_02795 [Thaumarchaeota archaeon]|nr:hypothetical protein [Nitrososphaerota archaeon]